MNFIKNLFSSSWELVYSTQKLEEYYQVKELLSEEGIKLKTKSLSSGGGQGGGYGFATTYQIYVLKEDVHRAHDCISQTY